LRRLALLLSAVALSACSPSYAIHASYEEARILLRREPITEMLRRPDLDPTTREKLRLVLMVREFASGIGLDVGGSYRSYATIGADQTIYALSAAPHFRLELYTWWFPFVGRMPYKGFFSEADARGEAGDLRGDGYDTMIVPVAAFSTLGWFDDPLLRHQLSEDELALANMVFHETYHNTFFAKGAHATAFNESLATFVGFHAAIDFFATRVEATTSVEQARDAWEDERRFAAFVQALASRLRALYATRDEASALREREDLFAAAATEFKELAFHGRRFERFERVQLNNAVLLQSLLYTRDLDVFEALAERLGGLRPALDVIERAARAAPADPFAAAERALADLG